MISCNHGFRPRISARRQIQTQLRVPPTQRSRLSATSGGLDRCLFSSARIVAASLDHGMELQKLGYSIAGTFRDFLQGWPSGYAEEEIHH